MLEGPDISRVAALIGDPARSNMLLALLDGRALTAGELATIAGITKQTASSHLARLLDGGLVAREVQGRHHYYRLGGTDVAGVIEALLGVSENRTGARTGWWRIACWSRRAR
jgi:DNA-binding transcriptional ArsR family regulator